MSLSLGLGTLLETRNLWRNFEGRREGGRECGVLWCTCGCLSLGRVSCLLARNKSLRSARDLRPFASLVSSASFDEPKSFVVLLERRNKKQPNFILYPLPRRRPPSRETWCRSGGRRISPPLPACVSDWEKAFSAADRSPLFFHNLIRALPPSLPFSMDGTVNR